MFLLISKEEKVTLFILHSGRQRDRLLKLGSVWFSASNADLETSGSGYCDSGCRKETKNKCERDVHEAVLKSGVIVTRSRRLEICDSNPLPCWLSDVFSSIKAVF
jgi:hypothetical protein